MAAVQNKKTPAPVAQSKPKAVQNKKPAPPMTPPTYKKGGMKKMGGKMC